MAFPSSAGSKATSLADAWAAARAMAAAVKTTANNMNTLSANGTLDATTTLTGSTFLADAKAAFQTYSAVPGIQAYAQSQLNDNTVDIGTAFTTMMSAIDGVINWIVTNFPASGGFLQADTMLASGRQSARVFSAAATAGLRTALATLIAAID